MGWSDMEHQQLQELQTRDYESLQRQDQLVYDAMERMLNFQWGVIMLLVVWNLLLTGAVIALFMR